MEEKCKLVIPDDSWLAQVWEYRQEFLECGSSMDGCGPLRRVESAGEWLEIVKDCMKEETVPDNFVPATLFLYVREADSRVVGMIQVRHYFNEFLEKYGGHIGYSIRPSERRKGYAGHMLKECLPYCMDLGLKKVLVTCLDNNEGSRRTILINGGVYENTVHEPEENVNLERYWITLESE